MTADAAAERDGGAQARLSGIEALRGYAASLILVFHVIHLGKPGVPPALDFMQWYFGFGVPLFFAVSAFSLAYGYQGRLGSWGEVKTFYARRFFRIAPLYYVALAATLIEQHLGPLHDVARMATIVTFSFNLFPPWIGGLVPASWSIGVEMLFYAVLPLLLPLARSLWSASAFAVVSIAGALAFAVAVEPAPGQAPSVVQYGFLFNLPYFAFGLLAATLFRRTSPRWGGPALALGAAGLLALYGFAQWRPELVVGPRFGNTLFQALWAAPFGLVCLGAAQARTGLVANPASLWLGRISFSIYLVHSHIIDLLSRLGVYQRIAELPGGPDVRLPVAVAATFALVLPLSWACYRFIEEPGIAIGRRFLARVRLQMKPAA